MCVETTADRQILDDIILDSRRGLAHIDKGAKSSALLFLNSLPPETIIESGSHVPMQPFPGYPWAGRSLDEIYEYFKEIIGDGFAEHNFAVVDKRTLEDGTVLLCSDSDGSLAKVRADGYSSLHTMVPDEMGTKPLRDYGSNFVVTEEYIMADDLEYLAGVQAKVARGEALKDIEKRLTGLENGTAD